MPKIQEIQSEKGTVLYITIPKAIARFKKWKKGDILVFEEKNHDITVKKVE